MLATDDIHKNGSYHSHRRDTDFVKCRFRILKMIQNKKLLVLTGPFIETLQHDKGRNSTPVRNHLTAKMGSLCC